MHEDHLNDAQRGAVVNTRSRQASRSCTIWRASRPAGIAISHSARNPPVTQKTPAGRRLCSSERYLLLFTAALQSQTQQAYAEKPQGCRFWHQALGCARRAAVMLEEP